VKKKDKLIIPFEGLKEGIHEFDFHVDQEFFSNFEHSIIENAEIDVFVTFEKKTNLFLLHLDINGVVNTECDRCLDDLQLEIDGEQNFVIKVTEKSIDDDDHIIAISPNEQELDLTHVIYENIHLLMPIKIAHDDIEDCNPEIIKQLNLVNHPDEDDEDEDEQDPRWDALKKIK
tara:strand:+ start:14 stop:535 length:522 start_codon:yes stop_codon:yes gene_type:complete